MLLLRARLSAGTAELHRGAEGVNESPGGHHWEIREDVWSRWGGLGKPTGGEQYSHGVLVGTWGRHAHGELSVTTACHTQASHTV